MASKRTRKFNSYPHSKRELRARVPDETFAQADLLASRRGVDRNELIVSLIFEEILREFAGQVKKVS